MSTVEREQREEETPATDRAPNRQVFPVGLLLEGRPSLVVGGGKVALHKVRLLLDARAAVTVVSPHVDEELKGLAAAGTIGHVEREFSDTDIDGVCLVFAATNDKFVNRRVVERCRARAVLCCSVDGNWTAGDFVTPATFRKDGLTVAVSTGGRSSRRSRMVKENLARHIELAESADLLVMGTSHEYLSIDEREPFHLVGQRMEEAGRMLTQVWGVHEFMLLNTCNRVELHAVIAGKADIAGLLARILGFDRLKPDEYYVKRGFEAFEHVALMSAGLFSQLPGEYHIVAQVKDALDQAVRAGWAHGIVQEWISGELRVSKAIRNASGAFRDDYEIEDLCIKYVQAECPDLERRRILVLGTGVVGSGIVKRLLSLSRGCRWCYHIKRPELPDSCRDDVALCTFDELRESLADADLVVCATDSPHLVLLKEHGACFDPTRPTLIVDLTMPRNVDPDLDGALPNLKVADLEDLKRWYRREALDMEKTLDTSRRIVAEHRSLYEKIMRSFQGGNEGE